MRLPARFVTAATALAIASAGLALHAAEPAGGSSDWPHWRGPASDGRSPLKGIRRDWAGGLKKLWETAELCKTRPDGKDDPASFSPSAPAVSGGILVAPGRAGDKDRVFGFDAAGGALLWSKDYQAGAEGIAGTTVGTGPRASPFVDGDAVYTFGAAGHLACWSLRTGEQKWLRDTRADTRMNLPFWGFCSSPVVFGDKVIIAPGGYAQGPPEPLVVAYDKRSGALAWKAGKGPGGWAAATIQPVDGRPQLIVFATRGVVGMAPESGEELWAIPWRTPYDCHVATPTVAGSTVFVTSGYNTGCQAFDIRGKEATPLWDKSKAVASCSSDPVIVDGYVYSFSGQGPHGKLKCIELATGHEKWATEELGNGSLVWADGCLLCLTYAGKLVLVEARPDAFGKLAEMSVFKAGGPPAFASPVVAGGRVYLRYGSRLVCYGLLR